MVERWNAIVGTHDEVWHLGNFAHRCGPNRLSSIFDRLKGRAIHLVRGRHDRKETLRLPWTSIQHYAEINLEGHLLVLFHYALSLGNTSRPEPIYLCGHRHGSVVGTPTSCNVGVDAWDFRPVSLEDILSRLRADAGLSCTQTPSRSRVLPTQDGATRQMDRTIGGSELRRPLPRIRH
ncbi:metallophosphoesterase family protein [Methylobacterium fujisawaense]|uniref:metallophosphoesterase family protein n=1 Tax=Methylobacterium fujisawaense TaxID=107400 RepID=UPI003CC79DBC